METSSLMLDEFHPNFRLKQIIFTTFQLIEAIPPDLKRQAKAHAAPLRDLCDT